MRFSVTDPTANIHRKDEALQPIETFIMLTVVLLLDRLFGGEFKIFLVHSR
jgi:hypothetical protein